MEDTERLFVGVVLKRSLGSEDHTMSATAFDYGIYLQKNDCTAKFTGATPEEITRSLCAEKGIPVASLPTTGIQLRRKFAGVKINQAVTTVWSLAAEKNGKRYAIRYTPSGLLVKERTVSGESLVLKAVGNLMDATTTEDASNVVNSVAIYDKNGNFLQRLGDAESQGLIGVMEAHITQRDGTDAVSEAQPPAGGWEAGTHCHGQRAGRSLPDHRGDRGGPGGPDWAGGHLLDRCRRPHLEE